MRRRYKARFRLVPGAATAPQQLHRGRALWRLAAGAVLLSTAAGFLGTTGAHAGSPTSGPYPIPPLQPKGTTKILTPLTSWSIGQAAPLKANTGKTIGSVTLGGVPGALQAVVTLQGAQPDTAYTVCLGDANTCPAQGGATSVLVTDDKGNAQGSVTYGVIPIVATVVVTDTGSIGESATVLIATHLPAS